MRTRYKYELIDSMVCNAYRATKSHEILMFFVSKTIPNSAVMPQGWVVVIVLADSALFGVFLETKKHQNLMRLSSLVIIACMQSMSPRFIMSPGPGPVCVL